jgi:uncharacterized protein YoaH (UPF0181 family)
MMNFREMREKHEALALGKEVEDLDEATKFDTYHNTFSGALQHAVTIAGKRGYTVDETDWHQNVATGPKRPSSGKTNRYAVNLIDKDGQPSKKKLSIQVYNMDDRKYELNMYTESVEVLDEMVTSKHINSAGELEMTKAKYAKTHKDFKTVLGGVKYAMHIDPKTGGSALFPVKFVTESVEEDLDEAANLEAVRRLMGPTKNVGQAIDIVAKKLTDGDKKKAESLVKSAMEDAMSEEVTVVIEATADDDDDDKKSKGKKSFKDMRKGNKGKKGEPSTDDDDDISSNKLSGKKESVDLNPTVDNN